MSRGKIIVISAPAGTGKTTLAEMLIQNHPQSFVQSVSCTTRKPRKNEKHSTHYHFLTTQEFEDKIKNHEFLEYAKVFDNYYGTLKKDVDKLLDQGKNVLLVIDTQGAMKIKHTVGGLFIFLMPPDLSSLENRLRSRDTDDEHSILKRLSQAEQEIEMSKEYDYVIINCDLQTAYKKLENIIFTEIGKENFT